MKAVEIKNLSLSLEDKKFLKDISISLESGKIYGILGDNFSGRRELLKIMSGLLKDYKGEVKVLGNLIREEIGYLDKVGVSLGIEGFVEEYTGYKNLLSLASIRGLIGKEDVKDALCLVGLDYKSKDKVSEYDFSMRKKLSIAQAIMEKPKLIIIDEPFQYLNQEEKYNIQKMFQSMIKFRKTTIVLGSRIESCLNSICDNIYHIKEREFKGI